MPGLLGVAVLLGLHRSRLYRGRGIIPEKGMHNHAGDGRGIPEQGYRSCAGEGGRRIRSRGEVRTGQAEINIALWTRNAAENEEWRKKAMETQSRRRFIGLVAKALGVLSIVPGTFFKPRSVFGADPIPKGATKPTPMPTPMPVTPFQQTLEKSNKTNLKQVLDRAPLIPEEKLAIAAVRELDRSEIEAILRKPVKGGTANPIGASGDGCGSDCGKSCGGGCGGKCNVTTSGVIDRNGVLGIKMNGINREVFKANVREALAMISPSGPRPVPLPR